jgi:MerR family copper efflux transcriptional regulator
MTQPAISDRFRVGQLAHKVGKTVRTIHFYEELGLVQPAERSKGGFRLYNQDALTRIHWIDRLQQLGFSLTEIRDFLGTLTASKSGPHAMEKLRHFYTEKLAETIATIEKYRTLETELQESLDYMMVCGCCEESTPRSACLSCDEPEHASIPAPVLVAAVHEPA